jgi:tetratricopeptide (TPR) repeat protein
LFNGGKTDEAAKLIDGILNPSKETLELKAAMKAAVSDDPADLEGKLANDPKNGSVLGRLCSLYRVPDPAKALDYCRRASDADPQNIKPAIGYGAALVQAKRYNEAVALFRKLLDSAGDNFTIHGNLATALFQLKRYPEAKVEYQWLAEKQPDLPITYFLLAICHDQLREYLDAFANYQQFIKLADPEKQKLEIDKVNLRLPTLQQQIKSKKGSK